jgi:hypothetical protein
MRYSYLHLAQILLRYSVEIEQDRNKSERDDQLGDQCSIPVTEDRNLVYRLPWG